MVVLEDTSACIVREAYRGHRNDVDWIPKGEYVQNDLVGKCRCNVCRAKAAIKSIKGLNLASSVLLFQQGVSGAWCFDAQTDRA